MPHARSAGTITFWPDDGSKTLIHGQYSWRTWSHSHLVHAHRDLLGIEPAASRDATRSPITRSGDHGQLRGLDAVEIDHAPLGRRP